MRPDFGAGLRALLFEPINTTTMALARHRVEQALILWEPRIDSIGVEVRADPPRGRLDIEVRYRVRTHQHVLQPGLSVLPAGRTRHVSQRTAQLRRRGRPTPMTARLTSTAARGRRCRCGRARARGRASRCARARPRIAPAYVAAIGSGRLARLRREWQRARLRRRRSLLAIVARDLEIQDDRASTRCRCACSSNSSTRSAPALLPAQSARTPLVFKLLDTATGDATVPAGTRVARGAAAAAAVARSRRGHGQCRPSPSSSPSTRSRRCAASLPRCTRSIRTTTSTRTTFARADAALRLFDRHGAPCRIGSISATPSCFRLAGAAQIVLTFSFATSSMPTRQAFAARSVRCCSTGNT